MVKWNPFIDGESSEFYRTVFAFARDKVLPSAVERDENERWDPVLWKELSDAGLAGLPIPEEYGGQSASCFYSCLATEAFASGCIDGGFGLSWAAHMIIGAMPIVFQGTEEQKKKYLPKIASGEWIAGLGLTEAGAGSDAASLETKAVEVDGGYILNGSKMYITNGSVGKVFIIMARTGGRSRSPMGISAFIVESDWKGFTVSKLLKKMGHHTSMTAELVFEDVFIPKENLLGSLNSGFLRIGKATLEWERTVLIAGVVGGMEYTLDASIRYANERVQFGKPISSYYAIQEKIVRNWIWMNAARIVIYRVARAKDEGLSLPMLSSIGKVFTSEIGEEVSRETVQLFGGYGFMKEYHVERLFRDLKLGTIGGGTSEIQRSVIAASFSTAEKFKIELTSLDQSIPGWENTSEEKIWRFLVSSLSEISNTNYYKKNQSKEFALADLLTLIFVLDSYRDAINRDTGWYLRDDKIRDSKLSLVFLIGKFYPSLQKLSSGSTSIQKICKLVSELGDCEDMVEATYQFLEGKV